MYGSLHVIAVSGAQETAEMPRSRCRLPVGGRAVVSQATRQHTRSRCLCTCLLRLAWKMLKAQISNQSVSSCQLQGRKSLLRGSGAAATWPGWSCRFAQAPQRSWTQPTTKLQATRSRITKEHDITRRKFVSRGKAILAVLAE